MLVPSIRSKMEVGRVYQSRSLSHSRLTCEMLATPILDDLVAEDRGASETHRQQAESDDEEDLQCLHTRMILFGDSRFSHDTVKSSYCTLSDEN